MPFIDLALVFLIALVTAVAVTFGYRDRRPWSFWMLLAVLFLVGMVVAAWARPVGPLVYGFAWLPVVMGSLVVGLLMLALDARPAEGAADPDPGARVERAGALYLWFLLGSLAIVLLAAFL